MLSLDVGRKRIGLAGCDALGITVTPLPALHRGRFDNDLLVLRRPLPAAIRAGTRGGLTSRLRLVSPRRKLSTANAMACA